MKYSDGRGKEYDDTPQELDGYNLNILRKIIDNDGDWFTTEGRSEFLRVLGRVLASKFLNSPKDGYDSVANDLIYSYWKGENGARMMEEEPKSLSAYSMEYVWDMLRKVNLGEVILPFRFVQYIKTEADVI